MKQFFKKIQWKKICPDEKMSWHALDAPERRNDDGGGHVALRATWHVPRPPRETFEKCCVRVAAQTGSGREPKLSGQKRLGLNCVSMGESAPRGQNCAPRGQFYFFSLLPSSSDTLEPRDPKFGTLVHVSKGYPNTHNLGVQKLGGQNFWFLEFFEIFCILLSFFIIRPKMLKMAFFWKFEILTPYFFHPLTYKYFESPCCTVPLYQISWNFVKGCRS